MLPAFALRRDERNEASASGWPGGPASQHRSGHFPPLARLAADWHETAGEGAGKAPRAKLRVEVRLKHLKAYKPSIWGEQSTLNVKNADQADIENMSAEELAKKIAELEHKDRVVNEDRKVA